MSEIDQTLGKQVAAARVLLGLGQVELAEKASISAPTLRRIEAGNKESGGTIQGTASTNNILAVLRVLQESGIRFLADGEVATGPGVSLNDSVK